jgi:hypothetical protein
MMSRIEAYFEFFVLAAIVVIAMTPWFWRMVAGG